MLRWLSRSWGILKAAARGEAAPCRVCGAGKRLYAAVIRISQDGVVRLHVSVHASEEGAQQALLAYTLDHERDAYWPEAYQEAKTLGDRAEMIRCYFEGHETESGEVAEVAMLF